MRQSRNRTTRRLTVQQLESRELLAGNVTAQLMGGDLVISGDAYDNGISIRQEAPQTFRVVGLHASGSRTLVNYSWDRAISNVTGDIRVDMGSGRDTVLVYGQSASQRNQIAGDLIVSGGRGNDNINVLYTDVGGQVNLAGGDDADYVSIAHSTSGWGMLSGGGSNDFIYFGGATFNSTLGVHAGVGNDNVYGYDTSIGSQASITLDDDYSSAWGTDTVNLGGLNVGSYLTIRGQVGGNKYISIANSSVAQRLTVTTTGGADRVTLTSVDTNDDIWLNTGGNHDRVTLVDVDVLDWVYANLGTGYDSAGNDTFELRDSVIGDTVQVHTGDDADTVDLIDLVIGNDLLVKTGSGGDDVNVDDVTAWDTLAVYTESGNDDLAIDGAFTPRMTLDGGTGSGDDLDWGYNRYYRLTLRYFESK